MTTVDLNCDLGEGAGHDAELMPLITSANIACGGHAGDERTMRETVLLARAHEVAIGAHPGYEDPGHFGRREVVLSSEAVRALVARQILALARFAPVRHVKPHGALYHVTARDRAMAKAVARAVAEIDPTLMLYGLAGSELIRAGQAAGLVVANEVFADRTYQPDGSLTPRAQPDALVQDESAAVAQVLRMIREGVVRATDGSDVPIVADTVCLHGDGPKAVALARRLRHDLQAAGVRVESF